MPRPDRLCTLSLSTHVTLTPSAQARHDMRVDEMCNLVEGGGTRICAGRLISESLSGVHFLKKSEVSGVKLEDVL